MEKLPSTKKGEHKVQFSDETDLKLRGQKVCGKPPEVPRAPPYSRSSSRLSGSSSISSSSSSTSSSSTSRFSSSGGSSSTLERSVGRGSDPSRLTSSLDRKRTGSVRSKTSDRVQKSDSSRSLSLDRRRAEGSRRESASPSTSSTERKRRECENRDIQNIQNREKKPKTRLPGGHSRSQSGEQGRLLGRQKMAQPTLSHGKGDSSKTYIVEEKSTTKIEEKKFPFHMDWAERVKRATSRSPSRTQTTTSEPSEREDKENEKVREKGKGDLRNQDKKERGRSLKRENRTNKHASNGKHKFEEHFTMDGDVMWVGSSRRNGYLIFNCGTLEEPPKNSTAQRYTMTFKFSQSDSKLIRMLMEAHGFSEVESSSSFFNLYWGNAHFNPNEIRQLQDWQKVNHFPRSSELTRKDRLYMNIKRMQRQFGVKLFDFIPTSFILPTEYRDFCDTHLRERGTWIVKPVASSQGKGIYLINQVDQVPADETSLLCRYIESPLLVDGYKCDLRLYVGVTSLDPLVVYLYEEGLVRLATVKYQHGKNLWNPCIHLTNYSVNKFHSNYVQNEDPEVDDQGNKWSLSAFLRHLKSQGIDTGSLMRSIEDVIIKSLLAASYQMNTATNMFVPHPRNCFELYGFDILIDSQLKPWVLEVNLSPSLNIDQPLDLKIKSAMLADLFSLVGVQVVNPYTAKTSSRPSVFRKLPYLRYSMDAYEKHQFAKGTNIIPTTEEIRIVRQVREEYERKGGWARIYPTPDSWGLYGGLQEYESPLNLVLHYHLYPHVPRTNRFGRVATGRVSGVSSSGLASSLERLTCYERALPKGLIFLKNKKNLGPNKKEDNNECRDLKKVKANVIRALENGLALSKYQARMAFSVYLQHIQRRLMIGCDEEKQTDLVYRFLRSASRTLHSPMNVQNPSKTLPSEARAVVISKQLGDFIQAYTRETHIYLDPAASASCSSLSSQCPTTTTTSSEPSTPYVTSPPYTSTLSINSPPAGSSVSLLSGSMSASTSFINHASAAVCGSSASINNSGASHLNTTSSSVIAPHHPVETPELCTPVKQSYSLASVSNLSSVSFSRCSSASVRNGSLLNKSASALSSLSSASTANNISHVSLSSISSVSVSNPSPLNQSLSVSSFSSPLSLSNSSSFTSTNNSSSIPFSASSNSISSPPSVSVTGSSTSINLPPPSKTPSSVSIASFNSASDIGGEIATLPPRIRRLKSDGDNSLSVADDGSKMSTSLDSAELEKHTTEQQPQQQQQQQQMSKDDHITMDLYRAFMSNAGESDLEEVLALQTRMHNSAGVFLESHRRSRIYPGSSHSVAGTATSHPSTTASSTCSSRPRTPTASPHGSPRRARRSPSTGTRRSSSGSNLSGSHTKVGEPVTNEPHSQNTEGPSSSQSQTSSDLPPSSSSSSSSTATTTAAMATTQASHPRSQPPATTTASSCCLFGNILKASLKGTNTFIS
ncbi:tubulin polyglutamylase TTLL5-like isoform X3 [Portunus trituberculatus]|uniref:tubulin polyglutamylase TTLL5-like isoform X3 n=1 Tax=Portunus trituberculatus TaxID=210409 RepID=UPI001E1CD54E|nr:tubulin polyglutamylase TTLL5-like isoform X3 [Portunus trituberculatus]